VYNPHFFIFWFTKRFFKRDKFLTILNKTTKIKAATLFQTPNNKKINNHASLGEKNYLEPGGVGGRNSLKYKKTVLG
jgi:hypothetical protein